MIYVIIGGGLVIILIGILWVSGITKMKSEYPDYRAEEYLNWDRKHDHWDDSTRHTEGDF